jgi:hypothetical protein
MKSRPSPQMLISMKNIGGELDAIAGRGLDSGPAIAETMFAHLNPVGFLSQACFENRLGDFFRGNRNDTGQTQTHSRATGGMPVSMSIGRPRRVMHAVQSNGQLKVLASIPFYK